MKHAQCCVWGVTRTVVPITPDIEYVLAEETPYEPTPFHVCDVIEELGG